MKRVLIVGVLACTVVALIAPTATAAKKPTMTVTLSEWVVIPKPKAVNAGKVKVTAKNVGGEIHELVIVKGNDAASLPTDADGAVDEEALPEDAFVGEIEDIDPGKSKSKKFKLETGKYVFFCNIVETEEDGTVESHFVEGMYKTVIVK
jgi:uncharacterized cupredoxin-like copper-binding protein